MRQNAVPPQLHGNAPTSFGLIGLQGDEFHCPIETSCVGIGPRMNEKLGKGVRESCTFLPWSSTIGSIQYWSFCVPRRSDLVTGQAFPAVIRPLPRTCCDRILEHVGQCVQAGALSLRQPGMLVEDRSIEGPTVRAAECDMCQNRFVAR